MRWLIFAVVLFVGPALSQQPAPSPSKSAQPEKKQPKGRKDNATKDARGTKDSPLFVKVVPAEDIHSKPAQAAEKGNDESPPDWVARFTGLLVLVGVMQLVVFGIQARRLRQTVEATEKAAIAAKESGDVVTCAERAYLFVDIFLDGELTAIKGIGLSDRPSNTVRIQVWNYGKTPAEVVMIRAYTIVRAPASPPSALIEFDGSDRELPPGLGIAKDSAHEITLTPYVSENELIDINLWNKALFCVGVIKYSDIFGKTHNTGFCWHHLGSNPGRLQLTRDSALNVRT